LAARPRAEWREEKQKKQLLARYLWLANSHGKRTSPQPPRKIGALSGVLKIDNDEAPVDFTIYDAPRLSGGRARAMAMVVASWPQSR